MLLSCEQSSTLTKWRSLSALTRPAPLGHRPASLSSPHAVLRAAEEQGGLKEGVGGPDHPCGRGRPGLLLQAFGLNSAPCVVLSTGTATAQSTALGAGLAHQQSCNWRKSPAATSLQLSRERSVGFCRECKPHPKGDAGPPASASQAAVRLTIIPVRPGLGCAFYETCLASSSIFPPQD